MYQVLHFPSSFSILPNFFNFVFLFFINNHGWRCQFYMLSFELWFSAPYQQVFIEHVMNHPSFQKFELKHSLTNILWDPKESVSFLVQLFWGSVQMDIFVFQPHIVSFLQFLRISLFLSNCFFIVSCITSINFVTSSQLLCSPIRNSSSFRNSICAIRLPFHGYLPKLSMNGVCPIAICFLLLY